MLDKAPDCPAGLKEDVKSSGGGLMVTDMRRKSVYSEVIRDAL
jgi:hypothetical protein